MPRKKDWLRLRNDLFLHLHLVNRRDARIRPGEKARVEFRFTGPVRGGVLSFDGTRFPVRDLAPEEEFLMKLPGVYGGGTHAVSFEATSGGCRIGAVKRYVLLAKGGLDR